MCKRKLKLKFVDPVDENRLSHGKCITYVGEAIDSFFHSKHGQTHGLHVSNQKGNISFSLYWKDNKQFGSDIRYKYD